MCVLISKSILVRESKAVSYLLIVSTYNLPLSMIISQPTLSTYYFVDLFQRLIQYIVYTFKAEKVV